MQVNDEINSKAESTINQNASKENPAFGIFNISLLISYAKDLYFICEATNDKNKVKNHQGFSEIGSLVKEILTIVTSEFIDAFFERSKSTALQLATAGIGDALALTGDVLTDILSFKKKLITSFGIRDLLVDTLIGTQLFDKVFERKDTFIKNISKGQGRKFTEEQIKKISEILVAYENLDAFSNFTIKGEIANKLEKLKNKIATVAEEFNLNQLKQTFASFNEILNVNAIVTTVRLHKDEITHLSMLVDEYHTQIGKRITPEIKRMLSSLDKIAPIYSFNLIDCRDLLNGSLGNKADLIARQFSNASNQVYSTYEGLGLVASTYFEFNELLNKINACYKQNSKPKKDMLKQIEHYIDTIPKYFQLITRCEMPLSEFIKNLNKLKELLKDDKEVLPSLIKSINSLVSCRDILAQKAVSINAFTDISEFIHDINTCLSTLPENKKEKTSTLFNTGNYKPVLSDILNNFSVITQSVRRVKSTSNTPEYIPLLLDILNYFNAITQSGHKVKPIQFDDNQQLSLTNTVFLIGEDHTNFHGIVENLKTLLIKHNFNPDDILQKPKDKCDKVEELLNKILKRYIENSNKYQKDHQPGLVPK